ncbi:lactaldehyde reductase, partial [Paenibacillus sp. 28ISP30-2]|nr:lactaldehyde reductase [Paenibacillus sp. 28ISP30-2]
MGTNVFYVPPVNLMGIGCLRDLGPMLQEKGFMKALIVTDK